jgi:SpoVK/Ycf46/Vps4 family AAA+-type ATPase
MYLEEVAHSICSRAYTHVFTGAARAHAHTHMHLQEVERSNHSMLGARSDDMCEPVACSSRGDKDVDCIVLLSSDEEGPREAESTSHDSTDPTDPSENLRGSADGPEHDLRLEYGILAPEIAADNMAREMSNAQLKSMMELSFKMPEIGELPSNYAIGLIMGPSGSGKTLLLKGRFSYKEPNHSWQADKSVASQVHEPPETFDLSP